MPPAADAPAAACPSKQRSRELSERRSASRRAERLSCPAEPMVEEAPEPAPSELADATQAAGIILVREPQRQQGAERGAECIPSEMAEMAELEVLIGRYEVINALKSKRNEPVAQRYPGEWHFPGGTKRQADRGPLQTACRELCEEFLVGLNAFGSFGGDWSSGGVGAGSGPAQLKAVLFSTVSLELQSQRYEQYVFVADVADNHLPLEFTTEGVNHALRRRRQHYERLQASEAWWEMAASAKAAIAPEVREVRWLPLTEALAVMDPALPFIDEWQASLTQVSHKSRTRLTQVSHKSLTSLSQASHKPLTSLSQASHCARLPTLPPTCATPLLPSDHTACSSVLTRSLLVSIRRAAAGAPPLWADSSADSARYDRGAEAAAGAGERRGAQGGLVGGHARVGSAREESNRRDEGRCAQLAFDGQSHEASGADARDGHAAAEPRRGEE